MTPEYLAARVRLDVLKEIELLLRSSVENADNVLPAELVLSDLERALQNLIMLSAFSLDALNWPHVESYAKEADKKDEPDCGSEVRRRDGAVGTGDREEHHAESGAATE